MKKRNAMMAFPVLASLLLAGPSMAQDVGKDVPPDHWAYQAVQDLASKGLIKGYPPDSNFLGQRVLTRYEMASIIKRVLDRMDDLMKNANAGATKDDLAKLQASVEEIRKLVDGFKVELTVIGQDLEKAKTEIAELKSRVDVVEKKVADLDAKVNGFDQRIIDVDKKADAANLLADQALQNLAEQKAATLAALENKAGIGPLKPNETNRLQFKVLLQAWYGNPFGRTLGGNNPPPYGSVPAGRSFGGGVGDTFRIRRGEITLTGDLMPGRGAYRVGRADYSVMFDIAKIAGVNTTTTTINGNKVVTGVTSNASTNVLQDLWVGYQIAPRLRVEVGQQKVGLSEEGSHSSAQILTVERSIMNNLPATVGRIGDIRENGAVLKYQGDVTKFSLGIWNDNGAIQNSPDNDRQKFLSYTGYYTGIRHLTLGVWGGTNVDQTAPNSARDRAGATFIWNSGPHNVEAEFAYGVDRALGAATGATSLGGYIQYAHTLSRKWQLVGRYDEWDPVVGGGTTTTGVAVPHSKHNLKEYTIGVNYFIRGHNAKIQSNYIIDDVQGGGIGLFGLRRSLWLTNFQVAF